MRLAVSCRALQDTSQVCGRDPVLAFVRQQMIGDAQQSVDGDLQADLLERFTDRATLDRFEEIHLAPDDAPALRFRWEFSQRQQYAASIVNEQHTGSHSWLGISVYGNGRSAHRVRFDTYPGVSPRVARHAANVEAAHSVRNMQHPQLCSRV